MVKFVEIKDNDYFSLDFIAIQTYFLAKLPSETNL
jgi:hypothetical protein